MFLARRALIAALISIAVAAVPSIAVAGTTTLELPRSFSNHTNCPFGYPNVATFGQSFVAPLDGQELESFTVYMSEFSDFSDPDPPGIAPASITYHAYLYAWDGTKAVGSPLWTGPQQSVTTAAPASNPLAVTTELGTGVPVTPGGSYVFFMSISGDDYNLNEAYDTLCWVNSQIAYADGSWSFLNNGPDQSAWTTQPWSQGWSNAFKAVFSSPDPEPVYAFDGFYAPVNNGVLNEVKAGSAIPVRFSLGGDRGLDVFDAEYPKSELTSCGTQEVDGIEQTVEAGASSLSYAAGSDTYTYVWKTDRAWADTCRQLVLRFNDGTTARANFSFK